MSNDMSRVSSLGVCVSFNRVKVLQGHGLVSAPCPLGRLPRMVSEKARHSVGVAGATTMDAEAAPATGGTDRGGSANPTR